ncbi:FxsA family protein [Alteromonas pelagimontana]|uniref:FxsA family protein n=1 Tax=Alteromonas pelagimontana TaxID=1858656 RepID=A0A6M4MCA7_9ALTE|nr:FxsA family protein [Alteromonas pelagimontana]QJR80773.1 FxsA family protein [Alteromonas pelagimontana]
MRVLFLLFAILPIIEIALLVQVGDMIGGWNTIAIVILTAFAGAYFVRREGFNTIQTAQQKMQRNEIPGRELVEGLMLVIAGVLLVTPGFVTDFLGLLLVVPISRHLIAAQVAKRMALRVINPASFTQQGSSSDDANPFRQATRDENGDIIEGQYTDRTENDSDHRLK